MDFVLELAKLIKATPKHALPMQECENCPYNCYLYRSKDCHLCFGSSYLESCMYVDTASRNKDCVDCSYINNCELCYDCLHCNNCYNSSYLQDCKNCTDSNFCFECHGCSNCFGCVGLQKKEFFIFNEKVSKEEYFARLPELKKMPQEKVRAQMEELRKKIPHPAMHLINCENVSGDYLKNSKNCSMCFHGEKLEDSAYLYEEMVNIKDCVDCTHIQDCELCYNLMSASECYNVDSSWWVTNTTDSAYCFCVQSAKNCFGCVYMQHKEFYILNKPYPKEEYFARVAEIKKDLVSRGLHGRYLLMDAVELARTL